MPRLMSCNEHPGQDRDEHVSGGKGRVAHSVNRGEHSGKEPHPLWLIVPDDAYSSFLPLGNFLLHQFHPLKKRPFHEVY